MNPTKTLYHERHQIDTHIVITPSDMFETIGIADGSIEVSTELAVCMRAGDLLSFVERDGAGRFPGNRKMMRITAVKPAEGDTVTIEFTRLFTEYTNHGKKGGRRRG